VNIVTAGENDLNTMEIASGYYACQLANMAADWRVLFGSKGASWTTVQLAPYIVGHGEPTLANFRQLQLRTTQDSIPNSHVAVIVDGGDPLSPLGSVHSRNKQLTGRRIAEGILALVYNDSAVTPWGPRYESVAYGSPAPGTLTATISFAVGTVQGGLVYVAPEVTPWSNSTRCPTEIGVSQVYCDGFSIIAGNGVGYKATSVEIVGTGSDQLLLTATGVPVGYSAVGSRFGWSDWPVVNFYSSTGLPVVPWYVNGTAS